QHDTRRIDRLARLLEAHGFTNEAMKYYRQAVELNRNSPRACMTLADKLIEHKKYEEAIELYNRIREQSPDDFREYFSIATQLKLLPLYETSDKNAKQDKSALTKLFRDVPPGNLLTLYEREMSLRKFDLARRVLDCIQPNAISPWEILYRQGELAACLGKQDDSRLAFKRLRQLKHQDNTRTLSNTPVSTIEKARCVLGLSVKNEKRSMPISDCFRGVTFADALVLFASVFSDCIPGLQGSNTQQVWYRPRNYDDAVLASRVWELKSIWQTNKSEFSTAVSKLREEYAVDWKEADRAFLYERLRRRCVLESLLGAWSRADKRVGINMNEQINAARRMMLSLGFLSHPADATMIDWRNQCGRLLIESLAFEELDAFWKAFDLDAAIERYYASPAPNLDVNTLRPKRIETITGMPTSLDDKLRWIIRWLESDVLRTDSHRDRLQSIYQQVSREVYEEAGQVMDLLAPVYSLDLSFGDCVMIHNAIRKSNNLELVQRYDAIMQKIFATSPDFNLNGAFAAITTSGTLLNASSNSLFKFNPCIAFPKEYKSLTDSLSCLDRFFACLDKNGNASAHDVVAIDSLFFIYLLHAGDLLFEWTELPRERYSWEMM
ncbi:MAG: tetratricopeptide repeat protein, partial [Planctomycetia bacterium]|nr:tetratricopeptide repeat protein [Planctomycetia bacterium]